MNGEHVVVNSELLARVMQGRDSDPGAVAQELGTALADVTCQFVPLAAAVMAQFKKMKQQTRTVTLSWAEIDFLLAAGKVSHEFLE